MPTFIAFLRAVNVGKRTYPMAELRAVLGEAGFEDVQTHIQTGNVRFRTSLRSTDTVRAALEGAMAADRGFAVPVCLFSAAELVEVYDDAKRFAAELGDTTTTGQYVALLQGTATQENAQALEARAIPGEHLRVGRRAAHLLLTKSFHEARTGNDTVEKFLGPATTRNLTVLIKLVEKWSA